MLTCWLIFYFTLPVVSYIDISLFLSLYLPAVSISISSVEIADFRPGPNEYRAASGPFVVTCMATGFSGTPSYRWTSTCRDCEFQDSISRAIYRGALHSGDTGTHTCTASSGTQSASANIVLKIVGKWLQLRGIIVYCTACLLAIGHIANHTVKCDMIIVNHGMGKT